MSNNVQLLSQLYKDQLETTLTRSLYNLLKRNEHLPKNRMQWTARHLSKVSAAPSLL